MGVVDVGQDVLALGDGGGMNAPAGLGVPAGLGARTLEGLSVERGDEQQRAGAEPELTAVRGCGWGGVVPDLRWAEARHLHRHRRRA
jgi:hypothetical protein